MKNNFLICIFVVLSLLLASCNINRFYSADPFYSSTGESDSIRFPLIKPYEAKSIVGGNGWSISLPFVPNDGVASGGVPRVKKIAVAGETIIAYTPYAPGLSEEISGDTAYWVVLIPSMNIQKAFNNENDFLEFIQVNGVSEINWQTPDSLYQIFQDTGCLEWIPGC